MKLVVISHASVTRMGPAEWWTKDRVGAVVDGLADLGWEVDLVARAVGHTDFLTHPLSLAVRVLPTGRRFRDVKKCANALRQADAALVFMPTVRTAVLGLLAGRRTVVYAGHSWAMIPGSSRWRLRLENLLVRRAAAVIGAGDRIVSHFESLSPSARACVPLVEPEVGMLLRAPSGCDKLPSEHLRVLFVGSVGRRKGVPELIEALRDRPAITCRIVGPTAPDGEGLDAAIRRMPNVERSGHLSWAALREQYSWADVLALPSWHEGFPRVAYEATAFGSALLLTPVGGIPDRLVGGRDAIFVSPGNAHDVGAGLDALADPELRARLVAGARACLAPVFSDADPTRQFDRALREVASSADAAAVAGGAR